MVKYSQKDNTLLLVSLIYFMYIEHLCHDLIFLYFDSDKIGNIALLLLIIYFCHIYHNMVNLSTVITLLLSMFSNIRFSNYC